jgi:hypothetical protein
VAWLESRGGFIGDSVRNRDGTRGALLLRMTTTTTTQKTPLFKSLDNDALRAEYRGWRALAFNNANLAASGAVNVRRAAHSMGRIMRNIEIIEAIARQRRISLAG